MNKTTDAQMLPEYDFSTARRYVCRLVKGSVAMKTGSLPSLRVDPELRSAAEGVLQEGETLSSFIEQSLRANIERRRLRQEFIARGLASRDEARRTSEYIAAEDVLRELDDMLAAAKIKPKPKAKAVRARVTGSATRARRERMSGVSTPSLSSATCVSPAGHATRSRRPSSCCASFRW